MEAAEENANIENFEQKSASGSGETSS